MPRLLYGIDEVAAMLDVDRRTVERRRSAGLFPPPDMKIGKLPRWRLATIDAWIDREAAR